MSPAEFAALRDAGRAARGERGPRQLVRDAPRRASARALAVGRDAILKIDVQGARVVKAASPEALLIFVVPPSIEALVAAPAGPAHRDARAARDPPAQRGDRAGPPGTTTTTWWSTRPARWTRRPQRIEEIIAPGGARAPIAARSPSEGRTSQGALRWLDAIDPGFDARSGLDRRRRCAGFRPGRREGVAASPREVAVDAPGATPDLHVPVPARLADLEPGEAVLVEYGRAGRRSESCSGDGQGRRRADREADPGARPRRRAAAAAAAARPRALDRRATTWRRRRPARPVDAAAGNAGAAGAGGGAGRRGRREPREGGGSPPRRRIRRGRPQAAAPAMPSGRRSSTDSRRRAAAGPGTCRARRAAPRSCGGCGSIARAGAVAPRVDAHRGDGRARGSSGGCP